MKDKSLFIKELRKFWFKKLAHLKKPRERKRKIVDRHAFATAMRHKSQGVKVQYNGPELTGVFFDDLTQFNDAQLKVIRERAAILQTPFIVLILDENDITT